MIPCFLHDTAERKRRHVEGDGRLREGGWWMEWGKGVTRTTSELKTRVGRWLDLLNKLGEVFLWNDEIGEGFSERKEWSWMDEVWMRLLIMKSVCTIETPALHQPLIVIHKSWKQEGFQLTRENIISWASCLIHAWGKLAEWDETLMRFNVRLKIEEMITKSYSCKLIKCWTKYRKTLNSMRK